MDGCAVDVECVRAARRLGLDKADARSCFLYNVNDVHQPCSIVLSSYTTS